MIQTTPLKPGTLLYTMELDGYESGEDLMEYVGTYVVSQCGRFAASLSFDGRSKPYVVEIAVENADTAWLFETLEEAIVAGIRAERTFGEKCMERVAAAERWAKEREE